MFLDSQCIVNQEDSEHKILNWSTLLPLWSLHTCRVGKMGTWPMRIIYKFRSSRLELLHEKVLFLKFWKVFSKTAMVGSCFNNIAKSNCTEIVLHCGCFPVTFPKSVKESFRYLRTAASVIGLYLHKYLHIFPIHCHLNNSESYRCSQVYIISGIYHIALLLLMYISYYLIPFTLFYIQALPYCFYFILHADLDSWMTELQGKVEGISLAPHHHFHPLHKYMDISRVIAVGSSPLHIGCSWTRTRNLWFLSASHEPLSRKLLTTSR